MKYWVWDLKFSGLVTKLICAGVPNEQWVSILEQSVYVEYFIYYSLLKKSQEWVE